MNDKEKIDSAVVELRRTMKIAAEKEEFSSASDIKRILGWLEMPSTERTFTETELSQLQSEVYKITGKGEVMKLFNKLLGVNAA
ncbi:MAG: hypothetical protein AABY15_03220 [Nanoarchaeota archaeon]